MSCTKAQTLRLLLCAVMLTAAPGLARADHGEEGHSHADAAKTKAADAKPKAAAAASQAKSDAAHDAMMADMMKYAMPGKPHELLKGMEGKWKATVKMWNGPGEPVVSEGLSEHRLIMGGRFVEQKYTGTFMGQPFEGYGLTGYDLRKGKYTALWIDNSSTSMMLMETGTWDDKASEMVFTATMPGMDGKDMPMRSVTKIVDANKHVYSMYATMEGKEQLRMEITYTK